MARSRVAQPIDALRLWTVVSLVGGALALTYLQAMSIGLEPILAGFVVLALIFAVLVVRVRRWTPLLGTLWSLLVVVPNAPYMVYDLTHPALLDHFVFSIILAALAAVGIVAGIGATVQHELSRRSADPPAGARLHTPRWFVATLGVLAGLGLGAILVATLATATTAAGVSAEALAQLPTLATLPNAFDRAELQARAGETVALRLENADVTAHSFDIDAFDVHTQLPAGGSGFALFRPSAPGTYTYYCGIPGHREAGMQGTLVVEP
jgi:nitrite reductase (NO-forming)